MSLDEHKREGNRLGGKKSENADQADKQEHPAVPAGC
jgi:hypothetical protein